MKPLTVLLLIVLTLFAVFALPGHLSQRCDVLIIGAGAAGMSAALEAGSSAQKVIILEKMPYPGGNSSRATGGMNAALNIDDREIFYRETLRAGMYKGTPGLVKQMVDGSRDAVSWLTSMGADLSDLGRLAGHSRNRSFRPYKGSPVGQEVVNILYSELRRQEIELRTDNKALSVEKIRRGFTVTVENRSGRVYRIRTGRLIIASGGFGGSPEQITRFNPSLKGFNTTNSPGATGDYITLTEKLNASIINLPDIQTHPTVEPDFGTLITEALRGNGAILVNQRGLRFTDEMAFRDALTQKMLEQRGGEAWLIFDQGVRESLYSSEYYFRQKFVIQAESLETLAEKLSLPEREFIETLERWNRFIDTGMDEDFGRRDLIASLNTPPYYAIKTAPGIHYCMGGLEIDERARVLDRSGNIIPGLYAAGEATGGIHGLDRLGGNSLTDAVVFGRIAGREASRP